MKKLLIALSLAIAAICWADPIQISVTGTSDSTALGYAAGQSYTFNWVINESYTSNPGDIFHTTYNQWHEDNTTDSMIFSSISGDGITGTYTQPSASLPSPDSYLLTQSGNPDSIGLLTGYNSGSMGMQVNGIELRYMQVYDVQIAEFTEPSTYTDPTVFFSAYQGSYAPSGSGKIRLYTGTGQYHYFTPTEVNIAAIPEPATLAFVGIFGGGLCIIRRYFPSV